MLSAGDSPQRVDMSTHSWALRPWWFPGVPASVPMAMRTPSSWARRMVARWTSLNSAMRWRRCAGMASTIACVAEQQLARADRGHDEGAGVGRCAASAASSAKVQCSMLSTPASTAFTMPWRAWACAATGLKLSWATSTAARSSSSPYWMARASSVSDESIAPVAITLIRSAPCASWRRTARRTASGAVGHLVHAGVVLDRGRGDRQEPAGEEQPRPGDLAGVDGLADGHLDVVPAADVPGRGDARRTASARAAAAVNSATAASERDAAVAGSGWSVGWVRWTWQSISPGSSQQPSRSTTVSSGAGEARGTMRGDPLTVDADVGAHEPLAVGVQHHGAREPAHGSLPCRRSVDQSISRSAR